MLAPSQHKGTLAVKDARLGKLPGGWAWNNDRFQLLRTLTEGEFLLRQRIERRSAGHIPTTGLQVSSTR